MLISMHICKYLAKFNILLFNNRPLFKIARSIYSPTCNFLTDFKLFSSSTQLERFPLHDIKDLNPTHMNCDKEKWNNIVSEILQAIETKVDGQNLPEALNMSNVDELLQLESPRQRFKFLAFLFKKEKIKLAKTEKKLKNIIERESFVKEKVHSDHIQYGLGKNTLLIAFRRRALYNYYNNRLAKSVLFGQKMVIDLGYDDYMWRKEKRACVAQLRLVLGINRQNHDPYDMYFCNSKTDDDCNKYLRQEMPNIDESLVSLSNKSYLDFFPKKNLVYLSPHASETLTTYDHNAVYIIGGFVDSVKREQLSINKAQSEGIKSYSLPLDQYVLWGAGSKSLSINQVFSIMLTFRDTGDWLEAFKHVPTRKMKRLEPDEAPFVSEKMFLVKK